MALMDQVVSFLNLVTIAKLLGSLFLRFRKTVSGSVSGVFNNVKRTANL